MSFCTPKSKPFWHRFHNGYGWDAPSYHNPDRIIPTLYVSANILSCENKSRDLTRSLRGGLRKVSWQGSFFVGQVLLDVRWRKFPSRSRDGLNAPEVNLGAVIAEHHSLVFAPPTFEPPHAAGPQIVEQGIATNSLPLGSCRKLVDQLPSSGQSPCCITHRVQVTIPPIRIHRASIAMAKPAQLQPQPAPSSSVKGPVRDHHGPFPPSSSSLSDISYCCSSRSSSASPAF